ncbi:histidinol-phosphate aminotransferase [Lysobacter helvus]|uniref:Histidinol-phosphate aminotransferase n=2 Tax=Lysobacteraceae TaxID=32033 RepID=A0ABN6FNI4_9GAMM|nr:MULTISPECIES: histidinol-phosphate transaminase [Lysobacter]BCT91083.1 histidinol-phosphate aminotransferase [Lysobacter caseinilyticus]BCT94236.1 histidinol-phosphate aminotransferase [Lysobacter helvus]
MSRVERDDPVLLLREDLRGFAGYRSARMEASQGQVWLNANEACTRADEDDDDALRRYPAPQAEALVDALAALYACAPSQLLVGRGSDEAIDLLVRAFCVPGRDAVLATPPVFGMYAVCARLQGARLVDVPLLEEADDFRVDFAAVGDAAIAQRAKLVFLCSPGNPAGGPLPAGEVLALAQRLAGRAIVVVDEAYIEYADQLSLTGEVQGRRNLAVLRTLSKAHALAGARIGCVIGDPQLVAALRRCQAPYPVSAPSAACALAALRPNALAATRARIVATRHARDALRSALSTVPGVRRVHPSQANFLLVRFDTPDAAGAAFHRLLDAGIVVRDMRAQPRLDDALRITVGTGADNARLLLALRGGAA